MMTWRKVCSLRHCVAQEEMTIIKTGKIKMGYDDINCMQQREIWMGVPRVNIQSTHAILLPLTHWRTYIVLPFIDHINVPSKGPFLLLLSLLLLSNCISCLTTTTTTTKCSEISCNVKWNVYLAMEIPDCVSFISGQNSDDRVRSCEPNVFLA